MSLHKAGRSSARNSRTLLPMGKYTFSYDWSPRVEGLTRWLVEIPSVVATEGEVTLARNLYDLLATWPYFQQHPEHLRLAKTHEDSR